MFGFIPCLFVVGHGSERRLLFNLTMSMSWEDGRLALAQRPDDEMEEMMSAAYLMHERENN